MGRVYHNKLVRDAIKDKIEGKGEVCEARTLAHDEEFRHELLRKVKEEAHELSETESRSEFLSEYADLMIALDALTDLLDISEAEVKTAITENLEHKGGFRARHFLCWSDCNHTT